MDFLQVVLVWASPKSLPINTGVTCATLWVRSTLSSLTKLNTKENQTQLTRAGV